MKKKFAPVNETVVQKLAEAIAHAEGFYKQGSRPARNHNPGNLTTDIVGGPRPIGYDFGNGIKYAVYATDADGWEDLRNQIRLMLNGGSRIYNASMTIAQMAGKYTGTEVSIWASNVARKLGVSTTTRLTDLSA